MNELAEFAGGGRMALRESADAGETYGELQERLPFTHVCLWSRPAGTSHEAACANLERVAREVAPAFAGPEPAWRAPG